MTVIIEREIQLLDGTNSVMAEFLMLMNDEHEYPQKWVKCIPTWTMFETMRADMSTQLAIQPGMTMPDLSFLGYITMVIREGMKLSDGWHYVMRTIGTGKYVHVLLKNGVMASEIADLTGYEPQKVKDFYREFFVVNAE